MTMIRKNHFLKLQLMLFWVLCVFISSVEARSLKNTIEYYRSLYGEVRPEEDAKVRHVQDIFSRVRAVADKNSKRLPKLVVVNSPDDPWAISLPDGYIVLSSKAVEICFQQANTAETDARLAFVMGHELAHLAHDDFLHNQLYGFILGHQRLKGINQFLQQANAGARELAADNTGFIYAAIAGYRVDLLLGDSKGKDDFFKFWVRQTQQQTKPLTAKGKLNRAHTLKGQLADINNKLILFDYGVRLSHFGACDDAIHFYNEFLRVYPGREVFNNLGYCHLQLAIAEMVPERAYFYWMPQVLDSQTRVKNLSMRSAAEAHWLKTEISVKAREHLNTAIEFFQEAAAADPGYLPARINAATAYLYLGKPFQARAVLEEILQQAPENTDALMLKALSLNEQQETGMDMRQLAITQLKKLVAAPEPDAKAVFNLARLTSLRDKSKKAQTYWNQLAKEAAALPAIVRSVVCFNQDLLPKQDCTGQVSHGFAKSSWRWPLPEMNSGLLTDQARASVQNWRSQRIALDQSQLNGHLYTSPNDQSELLELDEFVQMKVLKNQNMGTIAKLPGTCKSALQRRTMAKGIVWTCRNWAVLTLNDTIQEAWWMAK
jgi:tetratricopeptide (TPR) repeat protein